ncbi:MAG: amidohydrolase family protein [Hansschlegelia sp.]
MSEHAAETVFVAALFDGATLRRDVALGWREGEIIPIEQAQAPTGPRRLVTPAFANAHDHARPLPTTSFGSAFLPLEAWLPRTVLGTPPDAYLGAVAPFARGARAGCGAVMAHYTRPSGTLSPVDEARAVARAANDVGLRVAFAPAVRDMNPLVYGDEADVLAELPAGLRNAVTASLAPAPASPGAYVALVEEIAAAIEGPLVDVQFGPAGVQWCSQPLLEAIAEASAATGRQVHMHLLETVYQRAYADRRFPQGVVVFLKEIGLLSERLTLAHCVHARPDELELIAAAGATIVTNLSSNLHLKSGIAPIAEARRRGCRIAVGVEGQALDEDDEMVREARLAHLVHAGVGFDTVWGRRDFLADVVAAGRRATGAPGDGSLGPGAPADFVVFDLDALDRDAIMEVDPLDLLFARGTAAHVRDVVVRGRRIVADGRVTGVDLPAVETELRERYRRDIARHAELIRGWSELESGLRRWFCGCAGCG